MSDSGWWVEIVFLAMLAGFIALRLVSVLGRRTGHEKPVGDLYRAGQQPRGPADLAPPHGPIADAPPPAAIDLPPGTDPSLRRALQAIADADPRFEPNQFVSGSQAAYRMILEAFWSGDVASVEGLVSDDVLLQFKRAIAAREEDGLVLENRLVRINQAQIVGAQLHGMMAEVTVRFDADLVAVTRNAEGKVVAGSTSDAVETHDVWTFSRHVGTDDPNWLLIATDDEA